MGHQTECATDHYLPISLGAAIGSIFVGLLGARFG
jgi:hypothetical protein